MSPFALSPDFFVLATVAGVAFYGLVGGRARLRSLVLGTFVGIVLAQTLTAIVAPYLAFIGRDQVPLVLLALPIIMFSFTSHKHQLHGNMLINIFVGLAAGSLIVAAALNVLPPSLVGMATDDSYVALQLEAVYLWLVALVPLATLIPLRDEKRRH